MKNYSSLIMAAFSVIILATVAGSISVGLSLVNALPTSSAADLSVAGGGPSPTVPPSNAYSKIIKLQISPMMVLTLTITNPKFEAVQTLVPQIGLIQAGNASPSDLLTQYHDALKAWRDKQANFFQQAIAPVGGPWGTKISRLLVIQMLRRVPRPKQPRN